MSSFPGTGSAARPLIVPRRPRSFTQVSHRISLNESVVQESPIEEQLPSDSSPGSEPETDIASQETPSTLETKQRKGLQKLHIEYRKRMNEVKAMHFRRRNESRRAYDNKRTIAIDDFNKAGCWGIFRFSPRRKLDAIDRDQDNADNYFAKSERIERRAVERRFEDREELYIHCYRRMWKKMYPSIPFWYDRPNPDALDIPVMTYYQPID
ncbi:hypothetical protein CPAR01_00706 [Colletotrichum paranaense]|uniref:Uncharacterized protein n=1 Tax=Colletotrichum paranaense TaxID=1914294 RepID=A0ABQ9T4N0_9PEZI|nr:uncharacterized protein CPAR01_00706 [Colletotrichum paranaense]KAK1546739.1 hypothetical protein CPAR01_00706 [Colletotrichum paranaense]